MANPWLRKNPYMSMWLSGANAVAGSMRGQAVAQAKRQSAHAVTNATRDIFGFWTAALTATPPAQKKRRR